MYFNFPSLIPKTETRVATVRGDVAVSGPQFSTVQVQDAIDIQHLPPSFEYGAATPGVFKQLATDEQGAVGDVLRITYRLGIPFLQSWQTEFIVSRLNADSRFELRHVALNEEIRRLIVEVKVVKPFSPPLLVAVVIIGVLAGALIWLTTMLVERLVTLFQGDPKNPGIPWLSIVAVGGLVITGLMLWPKLRAP